ncbi:hypothetical protein KI387_018776 [Taxus chinensis]|uniref:PARP catalytic domain-containing protein n=1 Tax=Taxus chinensis TaxID=29808 RepID=A0AA38G681_TAXCH|nr:hypothetical protein KI387_018776 [Taxus chinensis]
MEERINAWMAHNRVEAEKRDVKIKVKCIHEDFLSVKVGGYMIQVTMPSFDLEDDNSDSNFAAVSLEEEEDEVLMETLVALNEKLERVSIEPNCLNRVCDSILQVFGNFNCRKPKRLKLGGEHIEQRIEESYVYRSAQAFTVDCEKVLNMADSSSIVHGILPWCSVKLIPGLDAVELQLDIKRIMVPDDAATALRFWFDHPLAFHVTFGSSTWVTKEAISEEFFRSVEVFVKQNPAQIRQLRDSMEKAVDGLDEKIKNAIIDSSSSRMRPYGPLVLVPEFVKGFFEYCKIGQDGLFLVRHKVAQSDNIFVSLVIFLGCWLKTLRGWCAICKRPLPSFSRLWFCNALLCLYRFEELGIGASVLQELQNSELIDLELTLAAAATRSNKDVFEPYPAFLLKKGEIRKRSGFFSNYMFGGSTISLNAIKSGEFMSKKVGKFLDNKNLDILRDLIDSFPPISEMQQCSSEIELVVKLGMAWLQKDCNSGIINRTDLSQEDYGEEIWLPYKTLRFVLFTNRSSLHLLQTGHGFNVHGSLYQFAILYNSESELNFEERRKAEGSVFAFHGSSISNWYSIIRNGLRCLSKTSYMAAGMAYGEGIYFSTDMNYSLNYSRSIPWTVHGKTKEYSVMALCEILSGQKYVATNRTFLVVPPKKENDVVIRYLLVFNQSLKIGLSMGSTTVTGGQTLSGNLDLYEHYEQLRWQHIEEILNGGLAGELLKIAKCF